MTTRPNPLPEIADLGDDKVIHIARFPFIQHLLDRLRLRRPSVLCGTLLDPDLDLPDPASLPWCRSCAERAGWV